MAFTPSPPRKPASLFRCAPVNGVNVGFGYASFILGQVDQISMSNPTRPKDGKKQLGLYAQDTWKVTPAIHSGLWVAIRLFELPEGTVRPRSGVFAHDAYIPQLGIPGAAIYDGSGPGRCNCDIARELSVGLWSAFGAAYQITPKTVFRAGFGIVYSGTASNNNAAGGLAGSTATTPSSSFGFRSRLCSRHSAFIPAGALAELRSGIFPNGSSRQHVDESGCRTGVDGSERRTACSAISVEHRIPARNHERIW